LYSILNEWRDEDMDDSPIYIDDDLEPDSSDMSDGPNLDDDEFALSTTQEINYEYFPETRDELKEIIDKEINKQGGVNVNLNMIDTSKITDISLLFQVRKSLRTLNVSKWNVSNVTSMFSVCKSLQTLDVSKWDVSNVGDMRFMFEKCESLHTDTSMWKINTINTNYTKHMYDYAPNIKHN